MRDEEHRHAVLDLQLLDEGQDLRLDRHVERRRRLVGDEEARAAGQRHGDHDALEHAARQLVRIVAIAARGRRDAHPVHQSDRLAPRLRAPEPAVPHDRLGDLVARLEDRVEARHRLLEDHRDLVAAHLLHLAFRQREEVAPAHDDLPSHPRRAVRQEAHHGHRGHALAGARLAHNGQRLTRAEREVEAVDDGEPLPVLAKGDVEPFDREDRFGRGARLVRFVRRAWQGRGF